jgi:hypothetical protein
VKEEQQVKFSGFLLQMTINNQAEMRELFLGYGLNVLLQKGNKVIFRAQNSFKPTAYVFSYKLTKLLNMKEHANRRFHLLRNGLLDIL